MKIKIGLVIAGFNTGGAEQVVFELAKEYKHLGHEVVVIGLSSGGNMLNRFKKSGIDLKEMDLERQFRFSPKWYLEVLRSRKIISHLFIQECFDVVHTHLMGTDIDCLYAARKAGTKVIVHTIQNVYRQFGSHHLVDKIRNWQRRKAYRKFDHIYAVADEVKKWAVKHDMVELEHISVIKNAIDFSRLEVGSSKEELRKTYGWEKDDLIILNIGSLTEQKNQSTLIKAVQLVLKRGIDLSLVIIGDGPLKTFLEEEICALDLNNRIQLLGYREDIPSLLKASDIFVFPSLWEGLPIALLEALACGIPVVASDIPVHRKILDNDNFGWLTPISNPERISDTLITVFQNKESSDLKSEAAKKMVSENYSSKRMAEDYIESYVEILRSKGVRI